MNGFLARLVSRALESPAPSRRVITSPFERAAPKAPSALDEHESVEMQPQAFVRSAELPPDLPAVRADTQRDAVAGNRMKPGAAPVLESEGTTPVASPSSKRIVSPALDIELPNEDAPRHAYNEASSSAPMLSAVDRDTRATDRAFKSVRTPSADVEEEIPAQSDAQGRQGLRATSMTSGLKADAKWQAAAVLKTRAEFATGVVFDNGAKLAPTISARIAETSGETPRAQTSLRPEVPSPRVIEGAPHLKASRATASCADSAAPELQPILPLAIRPTLPPHARHGVSGMTPSQRDSEGPRPVQVTIGRVEIRAVAPAPRPSAPFRSPRKPALSLSEYLGRKNGERR